MILPSDIGTKYPLLSQEDIYAAIEIAAIRVASIVLGKTMQAVVDEDGLHMYNLEKGEIEEVNLIGLRRIIGKPLLQEIETELMQCDAFAEAKLYKSLHGAVVTGLIRNRTRHGDYGVQVEINDAGRQLLLDAVLPRNQQSQIDYWRGLYQKDTVLSFHVYDCNPVKTTNRAWVRLTVSRTTLDFPCAMLRKLTGLTGIRCIEREPGKKSLIITRKYIPKSAINTVGKELKETLEVTCLEKATR